jgi:hypothetical protein
MTGNPSASRSRVGVAFVGYLAVSLLLYGLPVISHMSSRFVGEGSGDSKLYVWDLAWWPHAIASGLNAFHPTVIWAPSGANMAWVTGLPGPALVLFPITWLLGGVVASNVLAILAPALGAWAAYLLCREVSGRPWSSFAGGYLFGFSTYEVGQMHGHANLFLVFPVPLAAYLFVRFAKGSLSRRCFVWLLAAILVAEFSISTEVFATLTFFAAIALGGALVLVPELRTRTRTLLAPIAMAFGLAAIPLAPYLWYATASVPPALANAIGGTSVDLFSFLVPRTGTLIGGSVFAPLTHAFSANVSEDGAYLTPVLLVVLAFILLTSRRDRVTRLLFAFTGVAVVLSLGAALQVDGHRSVPLPWWIFERVPLLKDALPERLTMYMWLGIAVIVARWLSTLPPPHEWRTAVPWAAIAVAGSLLLPNVFLPNLHQPIDVPPFFGTGIFRRFLTPGETILILHSPEDDGDEMLWQERTGFAFNMPQGHTGPEPVAFATDPIWQRMKNGEPFGVTVGELQAWLRAHDVGAIVVSQDVGHRWRPFLIAASGSQPQQVGGVVLYVPPSGASGF